MRSKNEDMFNKNVFVNNFKYYLQQKGVTQRDVANALGISEGAISDWVALRNYPRMDKIQKLAEFFGCEKSDLVEDRSVKSKYHLYREAYGLEKKLRENPEAVDLFLKIERLSSADRLIVTALVESLLKGGK